MVPFERAWVSSYRPSMVTFPYLYAFRRYCRFCAQACHSSTTSLPQFPHVPWMDGLRATIYEEWRCWANCPCN